MNPIAYITAFIADVESGNYVDALKQFSLLLAFVASLLAGQPLPTTHTKMAVHAALSQQELVNQLKVYAQQTSISPSQWAAILALVTSILQKMLGM